MFKVTSFPYVTKGQISLQNFMASSFNPFTTLLFDFKAMPRTNLKLLNSTQDHPSKKISVLSNSYKI